MNNSSPKSLVILVGCIIPLLINIGPFLPSSWSINENLRSSFAIWSFINLIPCLFFLVKKLREKKDFFHDKAFFGWVGGYYLGIILLVGFAILTESVVLLYLPQIASELGIFGAIFCYLFKFPQKKKGTKKIS